MNVIYIEQTEHLDIHYDVVLVNAAGGDIDIYLPNGYTNKYFIIKKLDNATNDIVVIPQTNIQIEFAAKYVINTYLSSIKIVYNGVKWFCV